jgi:hypothetical protein
VNDPRRSDSDDQLDSAVLLLFRKEEQQLPIEPFMTQWRVLWEREGRKKQQWEYTGRMVGQAVVSLLIAALGYGAMKLFGSAAAALISRNVLPSLDPSLLLAVAGSFAVGVVYAYRSRVVRYLAPW